MYIKTQKCSFWCNDNNCSYIGKICLYFFLIGRSMSFFWDKDKISSGEGKMKGKRKYGGRSPKWGLFLQSSHYSARYKLYLTNCWSDKLLMTTIVIGMPKNLYAETFKWFQAVLPGQKQLVNICPQWCKWCRCHRWCRQCQWLQ